MNKGTNKWKLFISEASSHLFGETVLEAAIGQGLHTQPALQHGLHRVDETGLSGPDWSVEQDPEPLAFRTRVVVVDEVQSLLFLSAHRRKQDVSKRYSET